MRNYQGIYNLISLVCVLIIMDTSTKAVSNALHARKDSRVLFPIPAVNETCQDTTGSKGTCRPLTECRSALQVFRHKRLSHCGFGGLVPIVCCIEENPVEETTSLDISAPVNTPDCRVDAGGRISNGLPSNVNQWPWMVLLGEEMGSNWFCSGVLINSKWILTAAHCTDTRNANWVRLGEYNYNDDDDGAQHVDVPIANIVYHNGYKFQQAYHDLALIEIENPIKFREGISPVCLPWGQEGERNLIGQTLYVTGWGAEFFNGPFLDTLMEAELTGFTSERCEEGYSTLQDYASKFPDGINQKILCVGDDTLQGADACQGDSGGPSVYEDNGRYFLGGIVSTGFGCGNNNFPGIYVKIAHPQNLAWIKKHAFR